MDDLQLVINDPSEGKFLKNIDWNKEEFLEAIRIVVSNYDGLVYTEDDIASAKEDRAKLNALKKVISDKRIQIKKEVMAPYDKFKEEVDEVVVELEKPIQMIDRQIKDFEERKREEKKEALIEYFNEKSTELDGILQFENVFKANFLNASFSLSKAKKSIDDDIEKVKSELNEIELLESEFKAYALDTYKRTLDLSKALIEVNRLETIKKREEEEKKRQEFQDKLDSMKQDVSEEEVIENEDEIESVDTPDNNATDSVSYVDKTVEKSQNETTYGKSETISTENETISTQNETPANNQDFIDKKMYKASFTVFGTREQIMSVKEFLIANNIQFGK